ncbi:glycosyltransferase family 2 protein [Inquilinus limosus]|uniref:glycosyltransferase family 2 protein n=1 Tax=Inquilinus limosus TaxID=171674 RepID=UPI0003FF29C7|nr:glycosyltransferase family 2 protein [Inquilinus limosus]
MNHTVRTNPRRLSIVVPLYNEADSVATLHRQLETLAARLDEAHGLAVEVIYVDDGSRDGSAGVIAGLPDGQVRVELIRLSRNFGKEAALTAGLDAAMGDAVVFMDSDGQHPPELIDTFVRHWLIDGDDIVYAVRRRRQEGPVYRLLVKSFYGLMNSGNAFRITPDAADFRLLSAQAAEALRGLRERGRFFKGLSVWVGFRQRRIDYQPAERIGGTTKWSFWKLLLLSLNGVTSFSRMPLRISTLLGFAMALAAFAYGLWITTVCLAKGVALPGVPGVIDILVLIGGVLLINLGILGEYLGQILDEVKDRPLYVVAEHVRRDRVEELPHVLQTYHAGRR